MTCERSRCWSLTDVDFWDRCVSRPTTHYQRCRLLENPVCFACASRPFGCCGCWCWCWCWCCCCCCCCCCCSRNMSPPTCVSHGLHLSTNQSWGCCLLPWISRRCHRSTISPVKRHQLSWSIRRCCWQQHHQPCLGDLSHAINEQNPEMRERKLVHKGIKYWYPPAQPLALRPRK